MTIKLFCKEDQTSEVVGTITRTDPCPEPVPWLEIDAKSSMKQVDRGICQLPVSSQTITGT